MITIVISHALLAIIIWFFAAKMHKKKQCPRNLQIHRELDFCLTREEEESKRKKNKRNRKKSKKMMEREGEESHEYSKKNTLESKDQEDSQKENHEKQREEKKQEQVVQCIDNHQEEVIEKGIERIEQNQAENQIQWESIRDTPKKELELDMLLLSPKKSVQTPMERTSRKEGVVEELELLKNYFMDDLQEIYPYNGRYGHYKLNLEGSAKALCLQWNFHQFYPDQMIQIKTNKEALNLLEQDKIDFLFCQHQEIAKLSKRYFYIFNLATSIYQDVLISINDLNQQDDKVSKSISFQHLQSHSHLTHSETDLNRPMAGLNQIVMKEIHDQIFYLHDMMEKPEVSNMMKNQEVAKLRQHNTRGRYESEFQEIEPIGEGGFGKVYKVRHKLDGNIYAVKKAIVNYEDINDRKMLKEVSLLSKLNHPNIVRYYQSWLEDSSNINEIIEDMDFGEDSEKISELNCMYRQWKHDRSGENAFESGSQRSYHGSEVENSGVMFQDNEDSDIAFGDGGVQMQVEDGSSIGSNSLNERHSSNSSMVKGMDIFPYKILYIAMQLCNGINLREYINVNFDDSTQKIKILRGILEGLAYIHQKKIIHRDLKPANIFLTENNKVKIGDFGLAIAEDRSVNVSLDSAGFDPLSDKTKAVGTGFYRAPEQLKSHKYNEKADIYSLGIIMFELFYQFRTAMERADVLKDITANHQLPKDFVSERMKSEEGKDILQSILGSLKDNPQERPSAAKLLQNFRNKYFTQLVSCIANPKHFQFSQLLKQLFGIKNEAVTPLLWRDFFKNYTIWKLERIYRIHRACIFPTLPLIPVQDFQTLNGVRVYCDRNQKYLLLTNRGVVLEYTSNCLKTWIKYARQDFRRKKQMSIEQQRSSIRRYTFEKIVEWQPSRNTDDLCHHQKMITACDLAYKLDEGFNAFYLCETLQISVSIINTIHLTQRKPPIYMCHSHIYNILAQKYRIQKNVFFGALLNMNNSGDFSELPKVKRIKYFEDRNIPLHFAKDLCSVFEQEYETVEEMLQELQIQGHEGLKGIEFEIGELSTTFQRIHIENRLKWRLLIPLPGCNGFFWEIGPIKGITSVQEYSNGQQFCNYHIEMGLDPDNQIVDVSIWCIGEYLQKQMQKMLVECWKRGLTTRWYDWQIGEREDLSSRHSIVLRKRNDRIQIMLKHNEGKRGDRQQRESSFINLEQFNWEVIKQAAIAHQFQSFH